MPEPKDESRLAEVLLASTLLNGCLAAVADLGVWLGAGAVAQTVWNTVHGHPDGHGIQDLDLVYFDADRSEDAEQRMTTTVTTRLAGRRVDAKNQARVHLWYPARFGHQIRPYANLRDAVASWPTTATAVAVRVAGPTLDLIAPVGLRDLHGLVVRANRVQVPRMVFEVKAARWVTCWPHLTVLPWEHGIGQPGQQQ